MNIVRAVTVDAPADQATVTTSVHVVSTACSNMATVTTSKIYLDGVEAFTTSGAHIDHVGRSPRTRRTGYACRAGTQPACRSGTTSM